MDKIKIGDLVPDDKNFNKGNEYGNSLIEQSLSKFGAGRSILIDKNNRIIAGNKTVENAGAIGMEEVVIVETTGDKIVAVKRTDLDLDDPKARELALADNQTAKINIEWDFDVLGEEMESDILEEWGLEMPDNAEAEEDDYEIPEEIETDIVLGDLIEIGRHRLLCGDSTDSEQVARLMDGKLADMVFTDPPYGVNVKGGKSKGNTIAGDLTQTAIPFSFELAVKHSNSEARYYFCGGEGNIGLYYKLCERYLAKMPKLLIWVKNGFVMRPNGYHGQYELIFYSFKDGGGGKKHWYGERKEDNASDVWKVSRDSTSSYLHPTQKPIELPSRAIKNSSAVGQIVYEPFSGSASTMIACEQLNRLCYAMELDPKYCQVAVDRMKKLDSSLEIKINGDPYITVETSDVNAGG